MKTLVIDVGCYIEDATVNGEDDSSEKMLMPFLTKTGYTRDGNWKVDVDISTGKIKDWPQGTEAFVHYKCCDEGIYTVKDESGVEVFSHDGYVPGFLDFYGDSYGDYLIIKIDGGGTIQRWDSDAVIEWATKEQGEAEQ